MKSARTARYAVSQSDRQWLYANNKKTQLEASNRFHMIQQVSREKFMVINVHISSLGRVSYHEHVPKQVSTTYIPRK
jgi:hypothetical protein